MPWVGEQGVDRACADDAAAVGRALAPLLGDGPTRGAPTPFAMPPIALSSTEVRERIRSGRTVRHLVPRAVEDRIVSRRLYRGDQSA